MLNRMIPFLIFFGILGGCSLHSGSTYESGEMGAPAYFKKGVILSVRDIKIKGRESGIGAIAGATAGGLAGSTLGENMATKVLGGLGGAVVGGIVGNTAENLVTGGKASEFIIQPDEGEPYSLVQVNDENLKAGERVLIMESDKLRIVRDNTTTK